MGMDECKECFHYDVCCKLIGKDKIDRASRMSHFPDKCSEFKYRTNCVEVVRCKDCEHYQYVEGGKPLCEWHRIACAYDDFCSYGERREGA